MNAMDHEERSIARRAVDHEAGRAVGRAIEGAPSGVVTTLLQRGAQSVGCALVAVFAGDRPQRETLTDEWPGDRAGEFALGRACGRAAARLLGVEATSIETGETGAPVWPAPLLGSISHTERGACALVARGSLRVGVDVERTDRMVTDQAWRQILHEHEIAADALDRVAIFSAKEAFYKLAAADVGHPFWFDAVRVQLLGSAAGLVLTVVRPLSRRWHAGAQLRGNYAYGRGMVITWIVDHAAAPFDSTGRCGNLSVALSHT